MPGDADGEVLLPRSGPDPGPGFSSSVRAECAGSLCGQSHGLTLKIQVENFWPVFPSLWGFCAVPKECLQLECCHLYTEIKIKWAKRSLGNGYQETLSKSLKNQTRSASENKGNIPRKQVMKVSLFQRHGMEQDSCVFPLLICYQTIKRIQF